MRMFCAADGDLSLRDGHVASVIGYGNQGAAKAHPIFASLQARGFMDWDCYGPMPTGCC